MRIVVNTLVQDSDFAHLPEDKQQRPMFTISPPAMQELMQNITLSMLTLNQTNTTTLVQQTEYVNVFVFADPLKLILPYSICLALAVPLVIAAAVALRSNGVSASTNSFLQILCTTRGSGVLDEAAMKGCLGRPGECS